MGQFCQWLDFAHGSQAWCPNPNQGGLLYSIFLFPTFKLIPRDGAQKSVFSLRNCHSVMSKSYLFVTPWTVAYQALLSMGFSRQEYWSGLLCPPPGDPPDPAIKLSSLTAPALAGRFTTTTTTWRKGLLATLVKQRLSFLQLTTNLL